MLDICSPKAKEGMVEGYCHRRPDETRVHVGASVRTFERVGWNAQYGEESKGWTDVDRCKHVPESKDEYHEEESETVLPQRLN